MGDHQLGHEDLLTTRLALRRPTPADVDAIYRIHHDPAACAHNPADLLTTRADAEDLYRRWDQHWHQHGFGYWVIHPREADAQHSILGFCGLKLMRLQDREVLNLFYRLDPASWGNGIATEAATSVVSWATTNLPDRPVVARVRPDNVASATVAERTGLRRAAHLDTAGEDGLDWIFAKNWTPGRMQPPARPSGRETDRSSDPHPSTKHPQRTQYETPVGKDDDKLTTMSPHLRRQAATGRSGVADR